MVEKDCLADQNDKAAQSISITRVLDTTPNLSRNIVRILSFSLAKGN
jgi:hypothetical protein